MLDNINPIKSAITSLVTVAVGTFSNLNFVFPFSLEIVNTVFQQVAWFVAITAGIVSIVNGTKAWKILNRKSNKKKITK